MADMEQKARGVSSEGRAGAGLNEKKIISIG